MYKSITWSHWETPTNSVFKRLLPIKGQKISKGIFCRMNYHNQGCSNIRGTLETRLHSFFGRYVNPIPTRGQIIPTVFWDVATALDTGVSLSKCFDNILRFQNTNCSEIKNKKVKCCQHYGHILMIHNMKFLHKETPVKMERNVCKIDIDWNLGSNVGIICVHFREKWLLKIRFENIWPLKEDHRQRQVEVPVTHLSA